MISLIRQLTTVRCGFVCLAIAGAATTGLAGGAEAPRLIDVPSSAAQIRQWDTVSKGGSVAHWYSVSLDGQTFSRDHRTSYEIELRFARFDPLIAPPAVPASLVAPPAGNPDSKGLYIVQFFAPPMDELLAPLRKLGAEDFAYLGHHAKIVGMTEAMRDQVAAFPHVRWVGPFHPAYKLEEELIAELTDEQAVSPTRRYSIKMFERGPAPQQTVAQRIANLGGNVHLLTPQGFRLEASLTADQLLDVVRMHEVQFIDRWMPPEPDMNIARLIGGAVPTLSDLGFTGQGVRGEVLDIGTRITHLAFQSPSPLIHGSPGADPTHGTHTYGIVFGNGAIDANGTGMLPDREQGIVASTLTLTNRYTHTAELVDPNDQYRAVFQSNSWGSGLTTQYSTISAEMDDMLFINDIVITQSQSNTGNQESRPQAWAKNIVSIGGITHGNSLTRVDDRWTSASTGPAADGRVKPDLAHLYDSILCTTYLTDVSYTTGFGGTSGATPIVAGHFGLLFQMWHEQAFPCHGGQSTVFDSRPHMSTAKALLVNTAFRYNWNIGGNNSTLTRFRQGWGMPDVAKLNGERDTLFIVDETDLVTPLGVNQYRITVEAGQPEFRATMVYTDPAGNPGSILHRINDLSLRVTAPDGTIYWGNNGLPVSNVSTPGGVSNIRDTVENVFLLNPESGVWTVEVFGDAIVQDSHVETGAIDADYALIVTGRPTANDPGDANGDGAVNVADLLEVIAAWGPCPADPCLPCPADFDGNREVNVSDLLTVIANWGSADPA